MPGEIRVDIRGLRVQLPGNTAIYLIDTTGKKRHIPNPQVYNAIFKNWEGIIQDLDVNDIENGPPLSANAILFKCIDSPNVYLLDSGATPSSYVKRHIANPAVMDRWNFDWNKVHVWNVPLSSIGYPDGSPITNP